MAEKKKKKELSQAEAHAANAAANKAERDKVLKAREKYRAELAKADK